MNEVTILAPNEVVEQLEASERLPQDAAAHWKGPLVPWPGLRLDVQPKRAQALRAITTAIQTKTARSVSLEIH